MVSTSRAARGRGVCAARGRRVAALLLVGAGLLFEPTAARAHTAKVSRSIKLEPTADTVVVWVSLKVPPGRAKETLVALTDSSRNGVLDDAEKQRLQHTLTGRALDGVALLVGGSTRALDQAQIKLSAPLAADAPLELVILGTIPLPPGPQTLALNVIRSGDPIELSLLPGERPVTRTSRGAISGGGVETILGTPDRIHWTVGP